MFDNSPSAADIQSKAARQSSSDQYKLGNLQEVIDKHVPWHMQSTINAFLQKELRSPDMQTLRMVSMVDEWARLANEESVFLNMCEAGGTEDHSDFQIKFFEERIGDDEAEFFNPNGDFASEVVANRLSRDNTLGFWGNKISIRFIASELAAQSPTFPQDINARELELEMIRMRRFANKKLLANTEIKAETVGNIPQWGGYITRSTSNNLATTGDLTNALIQGRVDAIAKMLSATDYENPGYGDVQLVALCPAEQLAKIEDLMIARWPGETSATNLALASNLMSGLPFSGIAPEQSVVYKPRPGRPILFVFDQDMPANKVLFFSPRKYAPRLATFRMFGQRGPWVLERPTEALTRLVYVFNCLSLIDPVVRSRAVLTGVGT